MLNDANPVIEEVEEDDIKQDMTKFEVTVEHIRTRIIFMKRLISCCLEMPKDDGCPF